MTFQYLFIQQPISALTRVDWIYTISVYIILNGLSDALLLYLESDT